MADLIALLLATVSTLMMPGVQEAKFEQQLAAAVQQEQPAPIGKVSVDATKLTASTAGAVEFSFDDLKLDDMSVEYATFTVNGLKKGADGKLSIGSIEWDADI